MKDKIIIYQFENPCDSGELDDLYPICELCGEHSAMVEVTIKGRRELTCMGCYSTEDYQRIIKRDNAKIKLI